VTTPQSGEPGVIAIRRDPLRSRLQRERRVIGVGDEVATGFEASAQVEEYPPVPRPRCQHDQMIVLSKLADEGKRAVPSGSVGIEDPGA
jgi:hypothetical protein